MRDDLLPVISRGVAGPNFVFLTGDLGYKALEPLREAHGGAIHQCGRGRAKHGFGRVPACAVGLRPWVYSIAPFIYARPFEQIRNDVCLHRLPVVLVGNGGGYGYGVMGATHHALEDYGALLCLARYCVLMCRHSMRTCRRWSSACFAVDHPAYLRLGLSEEPKDARFPPMPPGDGCWTGAGWVVVVTGPLVGGIWEAVRRSRRCDGRPLWLLSELARWTRIPRRSWPIWPDRDRLLVVEEHVAHGRRRPDALPPPC